MPATPVPWVTNVDNSNLEELYLDHPFNWAMSFALFKLGDAGVLADVHRFRSSYLRLKGLKNENMHLERIIGALQMEKEGHTDEITVFAREVKDIKDRLVAARVRSRIQPILAHLAVEGVIHDVVYPLSQPLVPIVSEPTQSPAESIRPRRPPTPRPPNPAPPLPSNQGTEPTSPIYIPTSPLTTQSSSNVSSLSGETHVNYRIPDYSAGNMSGPHHQPTPFDPEHAECPPLPTQFIKEGEPGPTRTVPPGRKCFYCSQCGHWNTACLTPHIHCAAVQRCVVPTKHDAFVEACGYGGRTCNGHVSHSRRRQRHQHDPPSFITPTPPSQN